MLEVSLPLGVFGVTSKIVSPSSVVAMIPNVYRIASGVKPCLVVLLHETEDSRPSNRFCSDGLLDLGSARELRVISQPP